MRPIDVCTSKPFQLEHSCVVVSQRDSRPARCLAAPHEDYPRSAALRPRARPGERLFSRAVLTRPKTSAHVHRTARGHPMRTRLGRAPFSRRGSHFGARPALSRGVFLLREKPDNRPPSDIPVASSFPLARARISSSTKRWSGSRQDRFRGRLVKGVRFTDPGCLPPIAAARSAPEPKPERTREPPAR